MCVFGKKIYPIKIECPLCTNRTTMTYLEHYDTDEKNKLDQRCLNDTSDLVFPKMQKSLYEFLPDLLKNGNPRHPKLMTVIEKIGKHRIGGLLSKPCRNSEKIYKVFSYIFVDPENKTAGHSFRFIEEMLPVLSGEAFGKLQFVSRTSELEREVDYLVNNREHAEAIERMNVILKKNPDDIDANYNKGHVLDVLGKYTESIACYDKILEIEPDDIIGLMAKGVALRYLKKYDEAIACYDKVLEGDSRKKEALSSKGVALRYLKKYDEAIACYDKALGIDSGDLTIWMNKGNVLWDLKKYEESIACYDKALEIDSGDVVIWMNKGNVLRYLKKYEESIACYDKALDLKPNDSSIIQIKNEIKIELEKN